MAYYYFAASLPTLNFDQKSPLSIDTFLSDCERLLTKKDFVSVQRAVFQEGYDSARHPVVQKWLQFQHAIQVEALFVRCARQKKDPKTYYSGEYVKNLKVADMVVEFFTHSDLSESEKVLDRHRWEFLTELEAGNQFDFSFILVYALKLKILNKWDNISSPEGRALWNEMKNIEIPLI